MLAQAVVQDVGTSVVAVILIAIQIVLLVVFVFAIVKFFQMASDVRSILQLLVSEFEARDTD
jgi:hypothetical protein